MLVTRSGGQALATSVGCLIAGPISSTFCKFAIPDSGVYGCVFKYSFVNLSQNTERTSFFYSSFSISFLFADEHSSNKGGSYSIKSFNTLKVRPWTAEFQ